MTASDAIGTQAPVHPCRGWAVGGAATALIPLMLDAWRSRRKGLRAFWLVALATRGAAKSQAGQLGAGQAIEANALLGCLQRQSAMHLSRNANPELTAVGLFGQGLWQHFP